MKTRMIAMAMLLLILFLNACSPFAIASSAGQQPNPVIETMPPAGYQAIKVDQVGVEVGVGSPILVANFAFACGGFMLGFGGSPRSFS